MQVLCLHLFAAFTEISARWAAGIVVEYYDGYMEPADTTGEEEKLWALMRKYTGMDERIAELRRRAEAEFERMVLDALRRRVLGIEKDPA